MKSSSAFIICIAIVALLAFAIGYLILGPKTYDAVTSAVSHEWHRSGEVAPPDSIPFIGVWIDDEGQPIPLAVIDIGGQFYAYDVHPAHGMVRLSNELLYAANPIWWAEMPGGTK